MQYSEAIQTIEKKLTQHSPQRLKIPEFAPAAVVIPFLDINSKAHILFTKRTETVEHHKGQVSFPGGAWEEQDASLQETALRETFEEVGIPQQMLNVIGQLDDFPTISNFLVTPFVAKMPYPYPTKISTDEVAEILEVPLELFLTDKHFRLEERDIGSKKYPIYYYHFGPSVIWGVTGYIINRFIELVFEYNPAPTSIYHDPGAVDFMKDRIRRGE